MLISEKIAVLIFLGMVAIVYILEMRLIFISIFRKLTAKKAKDIIFSKPAIVIHSLALIGIVCFLYGYFIEPYWIQVNTVEIRTEKLASTSLRIVQISDLHCDDKLRNEKRLVDLINPMKPDIIVFTGDALNTPTALGLFKETLKELKANLGKFAVRGNFDTWYWSDLDLFGDTGFIELDGKSTEVQKNGETFHLSGVNCEYPNVARRLLKNISEDEFSILLYHYSDLVEDLHSQNVDLYLAGHTHGGQIAVPFYGALVTLSQFGKKYEAGKYQVDDTLLYVNRGIGMEGGYVPRIRFWARPEITIFDIKAEK
jgi:predicted MPP superfamily phosphohydrolase